MFYLASDNMWYEINEKFCNNGGVYIIKCVESVYSPTPLPINRLLGQDNEGILYIGKADVFTKRVADFKKSVNPIYSSKGHEAGYRLKSHPGLAASFPFNQLTAELIESDDPRFTECKIINEYEERFGELPPLNRSN